MEFVGPFASMWAGEFDYLYSNGAVFRITDFEAETCVSIGGSPQRLAKVRNLKRCPRVSRWLVQMYRAPLMRAHPLRRPGHTTCPDVPCPACGVVHWSKSDLLSEEVGK